MTCLCCSSHKDTSSCILNKSMAPWWSCCRQAFNVKSELESLAAEPFHAVLDANERLGSAIESAHNHGCAFHTSHCRNCVV